MENKRIFELEGNDSDCEEENEIIETNPKKPSFIEDLDLASLVKLEVKIGQTPILIEERDQTQTILVKVTEGSLDEEKVEQVGIDVVCLIDCSGSMNGFKLNQVKQTLLYVMEILKENDRIALVTFNSQAEVQNSLRLVSKENKCGRLLTNIQGLTAFGGTNIVGGLKKALKILSKRKTKNNLSSVFLLSDGNDNYSLEGLDGLLAGTKIQNFTINTFGYGEDHDPVSLKKIAMAQNGNFYYIKDLSRVDEAFVDCLALLTSVIGGHAQAQVTLIPTPLFKEINFKTCYGAYWTGEEDTKRTINIGNLFVGMEKSFIAEILLDANQVENFAGKEIKIAEVELHLTTISIKNPKKSSVKADLVVRVEQSSAQSEVKKDEEVEKNLLRVTGAHVMNVAKEYINKGDLDEANKVLEGFKTRIGKIKVDDVVLSSLNQQINFGQKYITPQQPFNPSIAYSKPSLREVDRRDCVQYMEQNSHAMMNQQSAPEWNSSLYQNKRQKRYMGEHLVRKTKEAFSKYK